MTFARSRLALIVLASFAAGAGLDALARRFVSGTTKAGEKPGPKLATPAVIDRGAIEALLKLRKRIVVDRFAQIEAIWDQGALSSFRFLDFSRHRLLAELDEAKTAEDRVHAWEGQVQRVGRGPPVREA